jgi:lipopolysaccharide/colanic/teichoic acid biosynthesis glycosyltransferase
VRNECVDIKVVPDLVQYATIKAALEDLDGIPIISLNEVPLRGWNSMLKRVMDVVVGSGLLVVATPFLAVIAAAIKLKGGKGPVFLRQERMTLDGKTFEISSFGRWWMRLKERRGRCGPARRTRAARRWGSGCAASTSTRCRSS